jgi:hypothetical protein
METNDDLYLFAIGAAVSLVSSAPFVLPSSLLYLLLGTTGGAWAIWQIVRRINRRDRP